MPRPEKPIAPDAPSGAFALRLRALRRGAGNPTYRAMAARIGHAYSVSTLAGAASGESMPNLRLTLAYAEACRGDRQYWTEQWFIARGADRLWPDETWAATPPDPAPVADPAGYVALLRELRLWAGSPSLHVLSRLTGHPRSSLGDACAPHRTTIPSEPLVVALVRGCLLHAYRTRPWLRKQAGNGPDGWVAGAMTPWLRTRHRLLLREADLPRRTTRQRRMSAAAGTDVRPGTLSLLAPSTVGGSAADAPAPVSDEVAPVRQWNPRVADRPSEVRALAASLRTLFGALDWSVRRFAARHHYDPGTVSRYLAGHRVPPVTFVHTLLQDVAARNHGHLGPEATQHILDQHAAARRVADPRAHRLELLREQLREAEGERLRLHQYAHVLEGRLRETEARIAAILRDDPPEAA
ncbi:hypothetical protein [Streptomyces lavendulocolor]|uniref:hypothetical protein n=1 Tax=Streptomyces lavendulocolor TaxID=67316 RepID=UPI003C2DEDB7